MNNVLSSRFQVIRQRGEQTDKHWVKYTILGGSIKNIEEIKTHESY